MQVNPWARREARARDLAALWPAGAAALRLLEALTARQAVAVGRLVLPRPCPGDIARIEPGAMAGEAAGLLDAVAAHGPAPAAARAAAWKAMGAAGIEGRLAAFLSGARGEPLDDHLARLLVQPHAAALAAGGAASCPFCATRPAASVLREDADAGALARSLVCSVCFVERGLARVLCPACGEERPEKLPRLSAAEIPWIRIEACESCGRYLKSIDLSVCPEAEPIADELGSVALDAVALERGLEKIEPNLGGV
jgi:FdhE protein